MKKAIIIISILIGTPIAFLVLAMLAYGLESNKPLPGSLTTCSPKNFKKIQAWFLERAAPQKLFGFIPISGSS
jgi:hypothetical protein